MMWASPTLRATEFLLRDTGGRLRPAHARFYRPLTDLLMPRRDPLTRTLDQPTLAIGANHAT